MGVVERFPPFGEDRHRRRHGNRCLSTDELGHTDRVSPNFTEDGLFAHELRAEAPMSSFAILVLGHKGSGRKVALDLPHVVDGAIANQSLRLPDQRIARIAMRHHE